MINAIAIVFAAILGIAIVAFVGIHLYVYCYLLLDSSRLRRALTKQGRTLTLHEAKDKIKQGHGMIIIDAPTLGWNVSRVWWSPVVDFLPRPETWDGNRHCPEEDILNYKRFIAPSTGQAKLVDGFVFTQRVRQFVARNFETATPGFVFTGGVLAEEHSR